ncbi:MAG TPA: CPBP family intramembrane glutamic endopeptidase, partial [Bacteroidales bacterium]|nr:CPBP family intramembrane glutamic endopeptidase [Bacteroidales bacterium]
MNYLETALKTKNAWWRYVVIIVAVFLASNTIGSIPLLIPYIISLIRDPAVAGELAKNPSDLSLLGVDPAYGLFMMLFPFLVALLAFALLVKPMHERTFKTTLTGAGNFRWNHFIISFTTWIILSALYLFAYMKVEPSNFVLNNTTISLLFISVIALTMIPFQAGLEEVLFRGYLMQGFAALVKFRWFPLLITSILFALMHSLNPEVNEYGFFNMMPQYFMFG